MIEDNTSQTISLSPVGRLGLRALWMSLLMLAGLSSSPAAGGGLFDIRTFGAQADDLKSDTIAIQKAIAAAGEAEGGTVLIPAGRFVSGPIKLASNVELRLAKGAVLAMSDQLADFPVRGGRHESFISGDRLKDVCISGQGEIDGQGESWWQAFRAGRRDVRRPQMIFLSNCERVTLRGITTRNPPNTHCSLKDCREITIEGVTMLAPDESPNTDALNLSGVKNVRISRCHISTGDDNIVFLTSGRSADGSPKVENVVVSDCTLGFGHGLSIGSYTSGGLRNLRFENISFEKTTSGIRIKSDRDRGGVVEDLSYANITMKHVKYPIYLTSYYPKVPTNDVASPMAASTPIFRNITISNLTASSPSSAGSIVGLPECAISNVVFTDIHITAPRGLTLRNAHKVEFKNSSIKAQRGPSLILEGNAEAGGLPVTVPVIPTNIFKVTNYAAIGNGVVTNTIVFPGNVGGREALEEAVEKMK
jgi:polygalacturonase